MIYDASRAFQSEEQARKKRSVGQTPVQTDKFEYKKPEILIPNEKDDKRNELYRLATASLPDLDTRCDFEIDSDEERLTQSDYVDLLYEEDQKQKFF